MNSIVRQFDQAATTYDGHSDVQLEIAKELGRRLALDDSPPERILEIGCGTGHLTRQLVTNFPQAALVATDASQKMVEVARQTTMGNHVQFQQWSANKNDQNLIEGADLIASSMVFQWFDDPQKSAEGFAKQVKQFAMSIPIKGTFASWVAAHQQLGMKSGVRRFLGQREIEDWLAGLPGELTGDFSLQSYSVRFEKPIEFVQSLRRCGASSPSESHLPVNLKRVFALFPNGIDIEYNIAFIFIRQRS